jgi:hypothetical protein
MHGSEILNTNMCLTAMKFLTSEVLITILLFYAALFFIFSTSLSLVYYQLFPQHTQRLLCHKRLFPYFLYVLNMNTLVVKTHSPAMSEMDNILRLRL